MSLTWANAATKRALCVKCAAEVEEGGAAVAALSLPGEAETPSASTAVSVEGAAAGAFGLTPTQLGGSEDASAEDGADIESCMFKKLALLAHIQNSYCGLR